VSPVDDGGELRADELLDAFLAFGFVALAQGSASVAAFSSLNV